MLRMVCLDGGTVNRLHAIENPVGNLVGRGTGVDLVEKLVAGAVHKVEREVAHARGTQRLERADGTVAIGTNRVA